MIRVVMEEVMKEITSQFCEQPLRFLNERNVVSELQMRLLKHYPETVTLTAKTLTERCPWLQPTTKRVHQEVATEGMERKHKVDIAILKSGEAELVGHSYRNGIPSTYFRDQDVIGAIEVKFLRQSDSRKKILRKGELKSYEASINKLRIIKRGNPKACCKFVVFTHSPCLRFPPDQEEELRRLMISANLDPRRGAWLITSELGVQK